MRNFVTYDVKAAWRKTAFFTYRKLVRSRELDYEKEIGSLNKPT